MPDYNENTHTACKETEINFEEAKDLVSAALEIKEKIV
jgi:hypothetical protein